MKKIRIAQIGLNKHSHSVEILESLLRLEDFEVVGICFPENEKERLPAKVEKHPELKEMTLEEILNDPTIEAVAVETDEIYLTKYATMALKAGKHVHMEKPGGRELDAFEEMIAAAKESGKTFHTGYMYRYNPYVIDLLEKAKDGTLGEIISVDAQMSCWHQPEVRQWLQDLPGGMMFYLGCHLVDLIYRLQGQPKEILPMNTCSGWDDVTALDCGMAVFRYENGVSTAKTYAVERGGFARRQLVVTGKRMTVELNPLEWYVPGTPNLQTTRYLRYNKKWLEWNEPEKLEPMNRYDPMMSGFAQIVRGERENPYTPDYELELFKLVLKACGQ
jgi:predicted dehydrogenase